MSANYTIRKATVEDVSIIVHQRAGMFTDMGIDPGRIAEMKAPFGVWVRGKFEARVYEGWLAVAEGGEVIAGAGLWLYDWMPSPLAPNVVRGYILNVYTERPYRRQGIARRLVEAILDYCREQNIHIALLHASKEGRPIYEALGFVPTNEMRLDL